MPSDNDDSPTISDAGDDSSVSRDLRRLIDRWETLAAEGILATAEQLCERNPDLIDSLRQHISSSEDDSSFEQSARIEIPDQIGPYRILSEISRSGHSVVYLAEQQFPSRKVVLKVLHDLAALPRRESRFRLEIELLGTLRHQNTAKIFDAGKATVFGAQRLYFAMEWIDGFNVLDYINHKKKDGNWSHRETLSLCLRYCDALSEAHAEGIVHRDLKPANLLVTKDGVPKLIDFGLAAVPLDDDSSRTKHSTSGTWVGTRCYMSPEQFGDHQGRIDARTDVYGFGVVLYRLLSGRLPYPILDRSMWETAAIVKSQRAVPIRRLNRTLGRDLEVILETALAKEPAERYACIDDLANDIRLFLDGRPISARRRSAAATLWKGCQRHQKVAAFSAFGLLLMLTLGAVTAMTAKLAIDRADKLRGANVALENREQKLLKANQDIQSSNRKYAESNDKNIESAKRSRRNAFNQTLWRLSMMVDREPYRVAQQLDDVQLCPPDLRGFSWQILRDVTRDQAFAWVADQQGIFDLALSNDGTWLATSGPSGVRLWDVATRRKLAAYTGPVDSRVRLRPSKVSKAVFFSRRDGKPARLDVDPALTRILPAPAESRTVAIACLPDSDDYIIASETTSETTSLSLASGETDDMIWEHAPMTNRCIGLTVSADGERFGAVANDGGLLIFDCESGALIERQRAVDSRTSRRPLSRGRFSRDLRWALLSFASDVSVIWDMKTQNLVTSWTRQGDRPDLRHIASESDTVPTSFVHSGRGRVEIWRMDGRVRSLAESGRLADLMSQQTDPDVNSSSSVAPVAIACNRDGESIAIGLNGGGVVLSKIQPTKPYQTLKANRPTIASLQFAPQGDLLAAVSGSGTVSIHDPSTGVIRNQWQIGSKQVNQFRFAGSDRYLVTRGKGRDIFIWDTETRDRIDSPPVPAGTRQFAIDGDRLLAGFSEGVPVWVPLVQSKGQLQFDETPIAVETSLDLVTIDHSSGVIAATDQSGVVSIWSPSKDGNYNRLSQRKIEDLKTMELLPGGSTLVTGTREGLIAVWETQSLEQIVRLQPNVSPLGELDISPDGTVMATGHFDGEVLFWDTVTWEPQLSVQTTLTPIRAVRFSPSADQLVVAGKGNCLLVFHRQTRSEINNP